MEGYSLRSFKNQHLYVAKMVDSPLLLGTSCDCFMLQYASTASRFTAQHSNALFEMYNRNFFSWVCSGSEYW